MLVDDVKINIKAGKGGDGLATFSKIPGIKGPTGGDGGRGGNVYFQGVSDLSALNQFRFKKDLKAENGVNGGREKMAGRTGNDLVLKIPAGTVIHNLTTGHKHEITRVGSRIMIAKGGVGGHGNFYFRSPSNTTPKEAEDGKPGQVFDIRLELKLIADVGFIGFPNVGKSSLLNELTEASSKVANYQFTTLEPNLGVYYELILADIPGLIEGASEGKGLGIKFLKHVERTKILLHFISAESKNPVEDYKVIRAELGKYNPELLTQKEYVFLSKADVLEEKDLEEKLKQLKDAGIEALPISIIDEDSIKKVKAILSEIKDEKLELNSLIA